MIMSWGDRAFLGSKPHRQLGSCIPGRGTRELVCVCVCVPTQAGPLLCACVGETSFVSKPLTNTDLSHVETGNLNCKVLFLFSFGAGIKAG